MNRCLRIFLIMCCGLALTSCEDAADKPYLKIVGGGFMFNLRYSKATYGFVARQLRTLPEGSVLEASFDLPDSEDKYVDTQPAFPGKLQYKFETDGLHGIKKNTPYNVKLRLLDAKTGKELDVVERSFQSDVDQGGLPTRPPVFPGAGYELVPE